MMNKSQRDYLERLKRDGLVELDHDDEAALSCLSAGYARHPVEPGIAPDERSRLVELAPYGEVQLKAKATKRATKRTKTRKTTTRRKKAAAS